MTGRVDQVDQELGTVDLLGNFLEVLLLGKTGIEGDGRRLDGDTPILFIGTGIHETSLTSLSSRNDTGTLDQGVGEGGLSVIDCKQHRVSLLSQLNPTRQITHTVSDDGHVPDVSPAVHEGPNLLLVSLASHMRTSPRPLVIRQTGGEKNPGIQTSSMVKLYKTTLALYPYSFLSSPVFSNILFQCDLLDHFDGFFSSSPSGGVV